MIANATIAAAPAVAPSVTKIRRPAAAAAPIIPLLDASCRLAPNDGNPASNPGASNVGMLGAAMSISVVIG